MGKLFGREKKYSDDEYDNEELDDEMLEDDEEIDDEDDDQEDIDDEEIEDDSEEDDDPDDEDDLEEEDEAEEEIDDENDPEEEDEAAEDIDDEEGPEEEDEAEEEIDDEDDSEEEDEAAEDIDDEDDPEEEDEEIDEDEEEDEYDEEEWDEEDRRAYRRRRRIRNQIIVYSVVAVFLAVVIAGCIVAGRSVVGVVREKKLAKEQQMMAEEQQKLEEEQEAHDVVIEAPEPLEEETEEDYLGEIVDAYISEMPLTDKVAGLFIVKPEAITGVSIVTQAGDGTREALNTYAVGGLVYFKQNISSREQVTEMLSNTFSMSRYPIFLSVDEEGGSVSRVVESGIDVEQVGDMAAIGASGDAEQARQAGAAIGSYLSEIGFNLDFAPVADMADVETGILGDRVFGSDAQAVSEMVSSAVEGIESAGVSSCLKHFPGIGDADGDLHKSRVESTKTLEEMRNYEFLPFKAGIEAGADFVMVSHIIASAVDEEALPSSLSKVMVTDILRNELGFQGVIITDALDMSAITDYYTSAEASVMAIQAGADMLLMPEDFEAAYEALLAAVQDGTISEERIDESLERIFRLKCADKLE